MTDRIAIRRPDDGHLHLRDGPMLAAFYDTLRRPRRAPRPADRRRPEHPRWTRR
jgi:hypothetical protein